MVIIFDDVAMARQSEQAHSALALCNARVFFWLPRTTSWEGMPALFSECYLGGFRLLWNGMFFA